MDQVVEEKKAGQESLCQTDFMLTVRNQRNQNIKIEGNSQDDKITSSKFLLPENLQCFINQKSIILPPADILLLAYYCNTAYRMSHFSHKSILRFRGGCCTLNPGS